jgi:hypothetical protein
MGAASEAKEAESAGPKTGLTDVAKEVLTDAQNVAWTAAANAPMNFEASAVAFLPA